MTIPIGASRLGEIALESWDLIDPRRPTRCVAGPLLGGPGPGAESWGRAAGWVFRVGAGDREDPIFAGHGGEQDFPGIDCRVTSPLLDTWGRHLRALLVRAGTVAVEGYWTFNRSGKAGRKVELHPVTALEFEADDCHYRCYFLDASGSFGEDVTASLHRQYVVNNVGVTDDINTSVIYEKVLAVSNCEIRKDITQDGLTIDVRLGGPGAYYASQSRTWRGRVLGVDVARASAERAEDGRMVRRHFALATIDADWPPLRHLQSDQVQWTIRAEDAHMKRHIGRASVNRPVDLALDVDAGDLAAGGIRSWVIEAITSRVLRGDDCALPPTLPFDQAGSPEETVDLRAVCTVAAPMPRIEIRARGQGDHPADAGPSTRRFERFDLALAGFPEPPGLRWEVASESPDVTATVEDRHTLHLQRMPTGDFDVRVLVEVTDPTGATLRQVHWAHWLGGACTPAQAILSHHGTRYLDELLLPPERALVPKDVVHLELTRQGSVWYLPARKELDLRGVRLGRLIKFLSRSAERGNAGLFTAVTAEFASRANRLHRLVTDPAADHGRDRDLLDWLHLVFHTDARALTLLFSRVGMGAAMARLIEDTTDQPLPRQIEMIASTFDAISAELLRSEHPQLKAATISA